MASHIERRKFLATLGGAAAAWPLAARAQQAERMRRIGVLMPGAADDPDYAVRNRGVPAGVRRIGLDRWAATCGSMFAGPRAKPTTFANTRPNWSHSRRTSSWRLALRTCGHCYSRPVRCRSCSRTSIDPVGAGFVDSLARPGGNATGFTNFEYGISGKWLELLKQIAPSVTRVAVLRDPAIAAGIGQFGAIQAVAPSLGVEVSPVDVRDAGEIERAVAAFARASNGGLIVTASALATVHRELIITLAARHTTARGLH